MYCADLNPIVYFIQGTAFLYEASIHTQQHTTPRRAETPLGSSLSEHTLRASSASPLPPCYVQLPPPTTFLFARILSASFHCQYN